MAPLRVLRVGVLLRGNLVEERVFGDAAPITIGQSLKCRLSLPIEGLPLEHVLFARDDHRWLLRTTKAMTGRIAHGATIVTELPRSLPLEPGVRGRIQIGDVTVLFQDVAAAPAQPRPQLPASVRGTFADRVDSRLAVIIGASLVAHLGIAAWAWATEPDAPAQGSLPLATYQQEVIDIQLPDDLGKLPTPTPTDEPGVAAPARPAQQTPTPIHPTHVTTPQPPDPSRLAADAQRFASIMTGDETSANGRDSDMAHRHPGSDLGKEISEVRDGHYKVGDGAHTSRDMTATRGTDSGLHLDGPDAIAHSEHHGAEPTGHITPQPIPDPTRDKTSLSIDDVIAKINGPYMAGLQRCYKAGLLHHGDLGGKVSVSFTVDEHGRVSDASATGVANDVDDCVKDQMLRWHFSPPKDKDGDPTDAEFKLGLVLRPS